MYQYESKGYPTNPGCYLMKDAAGTVIYVGKAKNLRRRLASYFQKNHDHWRTRELVKRIADIELILVRNEMESLVLENNLIKHYQPRFNVMLVDDRFGYGYLALTDEVLPRLVPYKRNWVNKEMGDADLDRLFGPYLRSASRYTLMSYVADRFQLRTCHPMPKRVCIRYEIGSCSGVCEGKVAEKQYNAQVNQAMHFLRKSNHDVLRDIRRQVETASAALAFERAQRYAILLDALQETLENQVVERDVSGSQYVLYSRHGHSLLLRIIRGMLLFVDWYGDVHAGLNCAARLPSEELPNEIITNDLDLADQWVGSLPDSNRQRVMVTIPKRGAKRALLDIAAMNHTYREEYASKKGGPDDTCLGSTSPCTQ